MQMKEKFQSLSQIATYTLDLYAIYLTPYDDVTEAICKLQISHDPVTQGLIWFAMS
jgi:hypothetical protein